MSAVEKYVSSNELATMEKFADIFVKSGFFGDVKSTAQALVKIAAGAEMGLGPFEAMDAFDIIQGKVVAKANFLASKVKESGKYDYRVRLWDYERCEVEFFQGSESIGISSFSTEDAVRARLATKENYQKFPRNMLFARAMSNGVATFCPDATRIRIFVEGEIPDPVQLRPIATARPEAASAGSPLVTEETIVDVEPLVEADPVVVHATTAESPAPLEPETSVSASTPSQRVKATLNSLSEGETAAVYEACDALGIKRTVSALRARFGSDAESRETLLPALAAAVNSPARVEGQITEPTADTPEEFEAWLTQQHADEKQRQGQIARAGAFGVKS